MSSIIIRTKDSKKKNSKTQAYTWASCIVVLVFLVTLFSTVTSMKNSKKFSDEGYKQKVFDLDRMPFSDDAAERMLLASARYEDIAARGEYLHTLFSESEKKARQRADIVQGITTEAAVTGKDTKKDKNKADTKNKNAKGKKKGNSAAEKANTAKGSLRTSSSPSYSGGGSGAGGGRGGSSSISTGSYGAKLNKEQAAMLASLQGEASQSLGRVASESFAAANSKDLERAAAGAVSAFEEGAVKESRAFLEGDKEKTAAAMQIDESDLNDKLTAAADQPDMDKLDTKLKDKKKTADEQNKNKSCVEDPFANTGCIISKFLDFAASIGGSIIGAVL